MFPEFQVLLFFIIPIKIKWLAVLDAVFFLYAVVTYGFYDNLVPVVAVLNFFLFCGGDLLDFFRPIKARNTRQAIHFRQAARQVKQKNRDKSYTRKVCRLRENGHGLSRPGIPVLFPL